MRIAILGATSEIAKDLILSFSDKNLNDLVLFGRDRSLIEAWCRFLININYAFQDREDLYLVCDLLTGGDLRFHIGKRKRFNEE
jgi:hypothetical protein